MTFLDIVLLAILFGFFWSGFKTGLVGAIGGLIGLVVGAILAGRWYERVSDIFASLGAVETLADILGFLAVFVIVTHAVGIIFWFLNKAFNIIAIIPGIKFLNRIGGAVLGLIEGALILGITLHFAARLPQVDVITGALQDSTVVPILTGISGWLMPLLPQAIREVQSFL